MENESDPSAPRTSRLNSEESTHGQSNEVNDKELAGSPRTFPPVQASLSTQNHVDDTTHRASTTEDATSYYGLLEATNFRNDVTVPVNAGQGEQSTSSDLSPSRIDSPTFRARDVSCSPKSFSRSPTRRLQRPPQSLQFPSFSSEAPMAPVNDTKFVPSLRVDEEIVSPSSTPSPRTPVRSESPPPLSRSHYRDSESSDRVWPTTITTPQAPLRPSRRHRTLLHGVLNGNRREVADALAGGEDPNSSLNIPMWVTGKPTFMLPILVASRLAYAGVLEALLRGGAVPNSVTCEGQNGLHLLFANNSLTRYTASQSMSATTADDSLHPRINSSCETGSPSRISASCTTRLSSRKESATVTVNTAPSAAWVNLQAFFNDIAQSNQKSQSTLHNTVSSRRKRSISESGSDRLGYPSSTAYSESNEKTSEPVKQPGVDNLHSFSLPDLKPFYLLSAQRPELRVPTEQEVVLCGEILLREGVDAHRKDLAGRTPKDCALELYGLPADHPFIHKLSNAPQQISEWSHENRRPAVSTVPPLGTPRHCRVATKVPTSSQRSFESTRPGFVSLAPHHIAHCVINRP